MLVLSYSYVTEALLPLPPSLYWFHVSTEWIKLFQPSDKKSGLRCFSAKMCSPHHCQQSSKVCFASNHMPYLLLLQNFAYFSDPYSLFFLWCRSLIELSSKSGRRASTSFLICLLTFFYLAKFKKNLKKDWLTLHLVATNSALAWWPRAAVQ